MNSWMFGVSTRHAEGDEMVATAATTDVSVTLSAPTNAESSLNSDTSLRFHV